MDYEVTLYGLAAEFVGVDLADAPGRLVLDIRLTSGLELR
jgi:hypothetical protein